VKIDFPSISTQTYFPGRLLIPTIFIWGWNFDFVSFICSDFYVFSMYIKYKREKNMLRINLDPQILKLFFHLCNIALLINFPLFICRRETTQVSSMWKII
jgi:hypothetical protein